MMRWLQEFGFQKSQYERPNQKWVCGRTCDGQSCPIGPDAKGNCTATTECRPLKKGDRWFCTRPNAQGGICSDGPLPDGRCCRDIPKCVPNRSLRSWRGVLVLLFVAATLGFILLALNSKHGHRIFSPGPLSFSHRSVGDNCAACHTGLQSKPINWLDSRRPSPSAHDNNQLCLNCHNFSESALMAHSLPPAKIQSLTKVSREKNGPGHPSTTIVLASFITTPVAEAGHEISCATCHKEHNGKDADLKKLSNSQCQSCHATQFTSFLEGHPQFTHYPFERRTRISFNHESHLLGHFNDPSVTNSAPHSCMDCHQTDLRGGTMVVKSFDTICASCHDDQIKSKAAVKAGIPFIGIPRMDDRTLTGKYSIGEWPEDADQAVTPYLKYLLSSDPQLRDALGKLKGADLSNIPKSDTEKLVAAQTLAWGIKGLILDLTTLGQDELVHRINLAAKRALTDHEKEGVVAFLNADAIQNAFHSAFPNLQKEMADYRRNSKVASTQLVPSPELNKSGGAKSVTPETWVSQGGWYSPESSFMLYYHPRGHSDRFLSSWMDLTSDAEGTAVPSVTKAVFKEISAPKAVGLCVKCHSIDATPTRKVNWTGARPDPETHGFEHFSHSTHLSLMDSRGCLNCHSINISDASSKDQFSQSYEPGKEDPAVFHGNFRTIDKTVCASCHQPNLVRDDCLLCHNYHIGRFKPVAPNSNIFAKISKKSEDSSPP